METVIAVASIMVIAAVVAGWAYGAQRMIALRRALYAVQGTAAVLLLATGLVVLLLPAADIGGSDQRAIGLLGVLLALTIGLPLLRPVRAVVARLIPIDPSSIPDMVGLSILLSLGVYFALSSFLADGEIEVSSVSNLDLILQAVALVFVAYIGVGALMTRSIRDATARLGIGLISQRQFWIALSGVLIAFFIAAVAGYLTQALQPSLDEEIQERLTRLTEEVSSVPGALMLGLSAGIGEEILFRGAIQPRFGLVLTSLIFALTHVQYGWSIVVVGVFLVGILFGMIRIRINTTASIITHAVYNFSVVMLSSMAQ